MLSSLLTRSHQMFLKINLAYKRRNQKETKNDTKKALHNREPSLSKKLFWDAEGGVPYKNIYEE